MDDTPTAEWTHRLSRHGVTVGVIHGVLDGRSRPRRGNPDRYRVGLEARGARHRIPVRARIARPRLFTRSRNRLIPQPPPELHRPAAVRLGAGLLIAACRAAHSAPASQSKPFSASAIGAPARRMANGRRYTRPMMIPASSISSRVRPGRPGVAPGSRLMAAASRGHARTGSAGAVATIWTPTSACSPCGAGYRSGRAAGRNVRSAVRCSRC